MNRSKILINIFIIIEIFQLEENGCDEIVINADEIELKNRNYSSYGELVISANVTERQTGLAIFC